MERGKHQDDWRKLCETRIEDAEVLLRNGRYDAAYYLAGYAVECALKARIASLVKEGDFPPKPPYVREYLYTHKLMNLLKAAELKTVFDARSKVEPYFEDDWRVVNEWSEERRYDDQDEKRAADMLKSAKEVVKCIREHWQTTRSKTEKN